MRKEGKVLGDLMQKYIFVHGTKEMEGSTMPSENCQEEDLFLTKRDIFEILEDNQIPLVKKKDYLDSYEIEGFLESLSFENLCRLLEINEKTKNYKVSEFCGKVFKMKDLQPFATDLYTYLENKNFSKNKNFQNFFTKFLKLPVTFFLD